MQVEKDNLIEGKQDNLVDINNENSDDNININKIQDDYQQIFDSY